MLLSVEANSSHSDSLHTFTILLAWLRSLALIELTQLGAPLVHPFSKAPLMTSLFNFWAIAEKFFQMKKGQCKDALEIYKRFLTRMTRITEFLKIAEV